VLSFFYVSEFLAVRGLASLILLSASPLLDTAFTRYDIPQRLFMVGFVYAALTLAIYLGASPYRLRDMIEWLQRVPGRARWVGASLAAYGLLLAGVAFTY
jgi:hydrogenase/urease accessory protein HupE